MQLPRKVVVWEDSKDFICKLHALALASSRKRSLHSAADVVRGILRKIFNVDSCDFGGETVG